MLIGSLPLIHPNYTYALRMRAYPEPTQCLPLSRPATRALLKDVLYQGINQMPRTLGQIIRHLFSGYPLEGPDSYPQYCYRGVTYDAPNYTEYELTTLEWEQEIEDNGY